MAIQCMEHHSCVQRNCNAWIYYSADVCALHLHMPPVPELPGSPAPFTPGSLAPVRSKLLPSIQGHVNLHACTYLPPLLKAHLQPPMCHHRLSAAYTATGGCHLKTVLRMLCRSVSTVRCGVGIERSFTATASTSTWSRPRLLINATVCPAAVLVHHYQRNGLVVPLDRGQNVLWFLWTVPQDILYVFQ